MFRNLIIHKGSVKESTSCIDANLSLDSLAEIQFEIGGTSAGTEFDVLTITDNLTLDGLLSLSLANGFTPNEDDIFEIITSSSLTGSFANVFDGEILQTADGLGEFTVNFGSGSTSVSYTHLTLPTKRIV